MERLPPGLRGHPAIGSATPLATSCTSHVARRRGRQAFRSGRAWQKPRGRLAGAKDSTMARTAAARWGSRQSSRFDRGQGDKGSSRAGHGRPDSPSNRLGHQGQRHRQAPAHGRPTHLGILISRPPAWASAGGAARAARPPGAACPSRLIFTAAAAWALAGREESSRHRHCRSACNKLHALPAATTHRAHGHPTPSRGDHAAFRKVLHIHPLSSRVTCHAPSIETTGTHRYPGFR